MSDKTLARRILLQEYRSGHSAGEAYRTTVQILGHDAPSRKTCYNWYARFKNEDFSCTDGRRPGRPKFANSSLVLGALEQEPDSSVRELSRQTAIPKSTVHRLLIAAGKKAKMPAIVPHDLSAEQLRARVQICEKLLCRRRTFAWLDQIVAMDEKWMSYDNSAPKRIWIDAREKPKPFAKPPVHGKKEMLSFFFSSSGFAFYEILPDGTTVTGEVFGCQLQRMAEKLRRERPKHGKILLLADNAKPHHSKIAKEKMKELGIEWLPHPAHSPDISPCDYHVFRSLAFFCRGKKFHQKEDVKNAIEEFIRSRPASFWTNGIHSLPDRWKKVVCISGDYITE